MYNTHMKKGVIVGLIVGIILIIIAGVLILTNNNSNSGNNSRGINEDINQMVDCGVMDNPACFSNRMSQCLPVTAKMVGADGSTIVLTILGVENETCHFQKTLTENSALNLDCYFPKGTMNFDTIAQTFGQDKGLQDVVDSACKAMGW